MIQISPIMVTGWSGEGRETSGPKGISIGSCISSSLGHWQEVPSLSEYHTTTDMLVGSASDASAAAVAKSLWKLSHSGYRKFCDACPEGGGVYKTQPGDSPTGTPDTEPMAHRLGRKRNSASQGEEQG